MTPEAPRLVEGSMSITKPFVVELLNTSSEEFIAFRAEVRTWVSSQKTRLIVLCSCEISLGLLS